MEVDMKFSGKYDEQEYQWKHTEKLLAPFFLFPRRLPLYIFNPCASIPDA